MITFIGVFITLYVYHVLSTPPVKNNALIGKSKVIDGIEYFNLGTLEDEDNWVKVGSAVVQYYVNVYEKNDGYVVEIEKDKSKDAYDFFECYDLAEAKRTQTIVSKIYKENGDDELYYE